MISLSRFEPQILCVINLLSGISHTSIYSSVGSQHTCVFDSCHPFQRQYEPGLRIHLRANSLSFRFLPVKLTSRCHIVAAKYLLIILHTRVCTVCGPDSSTQSTLAPDHFLMYFLHSCEQLTSQRMKCFTGYASQRFIFQNEIQPSEHNAWYGSLAPYFKSQSSIPVTLFFRNANHVRLDMVYKRAITEYVLSLRLFRLDILGLQALGTSLSARSIVPLSKRL